MRPSTHYSYGRNLRLHVVPRIGSAPVAAVDAGTLNQLYAALLANGRKDHAGGGLSPRTRSLYPHDHPQGTEGRREVGKAGPEPCRRRGSTESGGGRPPGVDHMDGDQLRAFLEGTRSSRHWTAYLLLATTGMRRGEVLGLRWRDLDLDAGRASIRQTVIAVKHTSDARHTEDCEGAAYGHPRRRHCRGASRAPQTAGGRAAADGRRLDRQRSGVLPVDGTMLHPERFTRGFSEAVRRLGLPRSGCTIYAMGGQRLPYRLASTPRSFRNASGTPTSASPWTPTATLSRGCTRTQPSKLLRCFAARLAIR